MVLIFWHWLILGGLLMLAELMAPGIFLIWLGMAAVVTGGIAWAMPALPPEGQGTIFAVLSVAMAYGGKKVYDRMKAGPEEDPNLNRRAMRYLGRNLTLDQPIVDGQGRAHLGDSTWRIVGPDLPAGTHVKVVAVEGTALKVEALH